MDTFLKIFIRYIIWNSIQVLPDQESTKTFYTFDDIESHMQNYMKAESTVEIKD